MLLAGNLCAISWPTSVRRHKLARTKNRQPLHAFSGPISIMAKNYTWPKCAVKACLLPAWQIPHPSVTIAPDTLNACLSNGLCVPILIWKLQNFLWHFIKGKAIGQSRKITAEITSAQGGGVGNKTDGACILSSWNFYEWSGLGFWVMGFGLGFRVRFPTRIGSDLISVRWRHTRH